MFVNKVSLDLCSFNFLHFGVIMCISAILHPRSCRLEQHWAFSFKIKTWRAASLLNIRALTLTKEAGRLCPHWLSGCRIVTPHNMAKIHDTVIIPINWSFQCYLNFKHQCTEVEIESPARSIHKFTRGRITLHIMKTKQMNWHHNTIIWSQLSSSTPLIHTWRNPISPSNELLSH